MLTYGLREKIKVMIRESREAQEYAGEIGADGYAPEDDESIEGSFLQLLIYEPKQEQKDTLRNLLVDMDLLE